MKKYLVETISQHRVRYIIEAKNEEHALDEVTYKSEIYHESWKEFSQTHLGDVIFSSREVSDDEIVELFDKDNDYLANSFTKEDKINRFVNKIDYSESKEHIPDERDWEYDGLGNKVYKGTMRAYPAQS